MEMKINIGLIKTQRSDRAWSQNQLAEVSGLSLRTIQRIEKTGVASLESVKSLASVFEIEINKLQKRPESKLYSFKSKLVTLLTLVGIILSGLAILPATAQSIMVDVYVSSAGKEISNIQVLNEDNSESEIVIHGALKIILTSKKEDDGTVNITTKLYDLSQGQEVLISTPSIITKHRESAEIHFGEYVLAFTPHL